VYGPPEGQDQRGPFCRLDEGRSYWIVLWHAHGPGAAAGDHPSSRWITYQQARARTERPLTFRRFSSAGAQAEVAQLLHVTEIHVDEGAAPQ
jgi:hypothetical protein